MERLLGRVCVLSLRCRRSFSTSIKEYSNTLFLPKTDFPMKANAVTRELELQERCMSQLYTWQQETRRHSDRVWALHDGPPYANGSPHIGHLLNKVLKDTFNRYKLLRGYRVEYVPGWDCHGLPIEHKTLEGLTEEQKSQLSPSAIRERAKACAENAIELQKKHFLRWGVMGDYDNAYKTMEPKYEAAQLGVFLDMVQKGLIYRGYRPVFWSPSSRTALAESELEYHDAHVSRSAYVAFPLHTLSAAASRLSSFKNLHALIWTTTPWTLPANLAVCVHNDIEYSIVSDSRDGRYLVATALIDSLKTKFNSDLTIHTSLKGAELVGCQLSHPFLPRTSVIIAGDHVTTESGTGLVHTAPGHGVEDWGVAKAAGIFQEDSVTDVLCPVDDNGRFTVSAGPSLNGLAVLSEGNERVLSMLNDNGHLLLVENYVHKYPYDWRTKQPIIVRATQQWFCNLESIQQKAISCLDQVYMYPSAGRARLEGMLKTRDQWCISRQRVWGVPIPVFYHKATGEPLMTAETVTHIQQLFSTHGSSCWWSLPISDLLPNRLQHLSTELIRGSDTMDVWFDSGTSWRAVLQDPQRLGGHTHLFPSSCYLEGSDQHRGWFQSSLLTAVASQGQAPYKAIVTHGFVLDDLGRKMSKSIGNVIDPDLIINGSKLNKSKTEGTVAATKAVTVPAYGVDVLRWWVGSCDYTRDAHISVDIVAKQSESLRKVRNVSRFMLGSLHDFRIQQDALPYEDLLQIDKYMLHRTAELIQEVEQGYESFNVRKVYQALTAFVNVDLSSFFFEVSKDRLYADSRSSRPRRSCQTVMAKILEAVTVAMAPLACHTAEDIYLHFPHLPPDQRLSSVFKNPWIQAPAEWTLSQAGVDQWSLLLQLRSAVNKLIEDARNNKHVRTALETQVILTVPSSPTVVTDALDALGEEVLLLFSASHTHVLKETSSTTVQRSNGWSIKGSTVLSADPGRIEIEVLAADCHKCPRCWKHTAVVSETLCPRCQNVFAS